MEVEAARIAADHAGDVIHAVVDIGNERAGEDGVVVRVVRGERPCVRLAVLKYGRERQIPCDGAGRADGADGELGVGKGLAARFELRVAGRAGRGRLGDGEGRGLVAEAGVAVEGHGDGVGADGQREAGGVKRSAGRGVGRVAVAQRAGIAGNGRILVLDASTGVDSGAILELDGAGNVGSVVGRDRQRIAAAVVVAGDRGDSDREGRRADFVLQPEGNLVFAFDNRRCHSEDVVSALNSGELDGEAGFGLACEEEVGRERPGLQVGLGAELGDRAGVQGQTGLVDGEGLAGRAGEVALAGDGNGDRASVDAILAVRNGVVRIGELAAVKPDSHFGGMGPGVVGHAGNIRDHSAGNRSLRDGEVLRGGELIAAIVVAGDSDACGVHASVDVVRIGNRVVSSGQSGLAVFHFDGRFLFAAVVDRSFT